MKRIVLSLVAVVLLAYTSVSAQKTGKIGYCNVDYVLAYLPATKAAQSEIATREKQIRARLEQKLQEFQTKYAAYEKEAAGLSELIRADREKELTNLKNEIDAFQQQAEMDLAKKQEEVMQPVFDQINNAIKEVALENDFVYILNANAQGLSIVLYAPEENNVSNLILKKMGVNPPPLTGN